MKINSVTRALAGLVFCAGMTGAAQAAVTYEYTAPVADSFTTITNGVYSGAPYAGQGPLYSFSFQRESNVIENLSTSDLSGLAFTFNYSGTTTNFIYNYNPNDDEQPFLTFDDGTARPSAWDMHSLLNVAGLGYVSFESTSTFDFVVRPQADGSLHVWSAGPNALQGTWRIAEVPEPASLSMLLIGFAGLAGARRSAKRKSR